MPQCLPAMQSQAVEQVSTHIQTVGLRHVELFTFARQTHGLVITAHSLDVVRTDVARKN
jgi:hypothetical protein